MAPEYVGFGLNRGLSLPARTVSYSSGETAR